MTYLWVYRIKRPVHKIHPTPSNKNALFCIHHGRNKHIHLLCIKRYHPEKTNPPITMHVSQTYIDQPTWQINNEWGTGKLYQNYRNIFLTFIWAMRVPKIFLQIHHHYVFSFLILVTALQHKRKTCVSSQFDWSNLFLKPHLHKIYILLRSTAEQSRGIDTNNSLHLAFCIFCHRSFILIP